MTRDPTSTIDDPLRGILEREQLEHCLMASFCAKLVARRPPLALALDSHCHGRTLFPNNSLQMVRMRTF
jgi:hypothetical protein